MATTTKPAGEVLARLLRRKRGATIEQMATATGWNPASVRAWISRQRAAGTEIESLGGPGRCGAPAAFRLG